METTLRERLPEMSTRPLQERVAFLAKLSWQVASLHKTNQLHGNITPEAVQVKDGGPDLAPPSPEVKKTLGYSAPELLRGERQAHTIKTDIFSLGVLCYELLSSQKPFEGTSDMQVLLATLEGKPKPLSQWVAECPDALNGLCLKMLSANKENRPVSVEDIARAMDEILWRMQAPKEDPSIDKPRSALSIIQEIAQEVSADETQAADGLPATLATPANVSVEKSGSSTPRSGSGQGSGSNRAHIFQPQSSPSDTLLHGNVGFQPTLPEQALSPSQRYKVLGELARGGLGKILRATDQHMGRPVAIKEMLQRLPGEFETRFLREAKITARLEHPAIIPVHDLGKWSDGSMYYTMKLVNGRSFDKIIAENKTMEERIALLPHVIAAADAIAYSHSQHIIHRDLKPHNVLIGPFGETVVIDWGIAKDLSDPSDTESPEVPYREAQDHGELTREGAIVGTPAYMPLEQAQGKKVDARADVYSLGAILYHLLSGKSPYSGKRSVAILRDLLEGPPKPLQERVPDVPKELVTIVEKAMARSLEERYPTAQELADDLKKYQTGQLVGSYQYSSWEILARTVKKYQLPIAVGALAAVVLLMSAAWYAMSISEKNRALARKNNEVATANQGLTAANTLLEDINGKEALESERKTIDAARAALEDDPAEAIRQLKKLRWQYPQPIEEIRMIAEEAIVRGLPTPLPLVDNPKGAKNFMLVQSPDEKYLASAEYYLDKEGAPEGVVGLRELQTGKFRELITGVPSGVNGVWFSPDGKWLAALGADWNVYLWSVGDWEQHQKLTSNAPGEPLSLAFSEDSLSIVAGGDGPILYRWTLSSPQEPETFDSSEWPIPQELSSIPFRFWSVATAGDFVLAERADGTVFYIDPAFKKAKTQVRKNLINYVQGSIVYIKEKNIAIFDGKSFDSFLIWDLDNNRKFEINEIVYSTQQINNNLIMTITNKNIIKTWNVTTGIEEKNQEIYGYHGILSHLNTRTDKNLIIAKNQDGNLFVWDLAIKGDVVLKLKDYRNIIIPEVGEYFYLFSEDRNKINKRKYNEINKLPMDDLAIHDISISPDGKTLAVIDLAGKAYLLRLDDFSIIKSMDTNSGYAIEFSFDGKLIAIACNDLEVLVWNINDDSIVKLSGHEGYPSHLSFSPKENKLLSSSQEMETFIWDLNTGKNEKLTPSLSGEGVADFSTDGTLYVYNEEETLIIKNKETKTKKKFDYIVLGSVFSNKSNKIAAWDNKKIKIINNDNSENDFLISDIYRAIFINDEYLVYSQNKKTWLLDVASGQKMQIPMGARLPSFAVHPQTNKLIAVTQAGSVYSWSPSLLLSEEALQAWLSAQP